MVSIYNTRCQLHVELYPHIGAYSHLLAHSVCRTYGDEEEREVFFPKNLHSDNASLE